MNGALLFSVALAYAGVLFLVAYRVDSAGPGWVSQESRAAAYALSLTVYCTSWTFYGAVGSASLGGWAYLPIWQRTPPNRLI